MKQVEKIWAELSAKAQEVETPQEVELSEEQKVELALADNLAKYAKGVNPYINEGESLISSAEKMLNEIKSIKSKLFTTANDMKSLADDSASDLVAFEKAAKELGIDPNSNANYKSASKAFDAYAKNSQKFERYAKEL
jgi:predicted Rossmann fold nucleotide-binding protein DprA/Smf involved in DNA uptake